jgi:translation initiation factor 4G
VIDVFFVFVCRILNKLTPEKFDKLSLELLNVGIDSPVVLKGVILLVRTTTAWYFRLVIT